MIIMSCFSDWRKKVCIVNNQIKILELKDYKGEYDLGIADQVDAQTIIGIFTQNQKLYFVKNNQIYDITNEKIECNNTRTKDIRNFELKINDKIFYNKTYESFVTLSDVVCGTIEEDEDFLVNLSNILENDESIKKFVQGWTYQK